MRQQEATTTGKPFPATDVFDVAVSRMNMEETLDYLVAAAERGTSMHVITANPIMLMDAISDPLFMDTMQQADLVVPDGAGLVWAAGYLGSSVKERVAGFDLLHGLLQEGQNYGWRVYLLGTTADIVRAAADKISQQYPGITIAGYRDGFFSAEQDEEVIAAVTAASPHLLFVARSGATQDPWIAKHRHQLQVPIMMGVGGSFDVIAGKLKRAPIWMQRIGLEWLYRLVKQPSRFGRMLALPRFVWQVIRERRKRNKLN